MSETEQKDAPAGSKAEGTPNKPKLKGKDKGEEKSADKEAPKNEFAPISSSYSPTSLTPCYRKKYFKAVIFEKKEKSFNKVLLVDSEPYIVSTVVRWPSLSLNCHRF